MLDALRKGAGTWVAKIFIGILVLSFAVWGIADIFGGYGQQSLGHVGNVEITEADYRRAYQDQIRVVSNQLRRQVTPEMARNFGITSQVMTRLIAGAALDSHADKLGISLSEKALADLIRSDRQFQDSTGKFSRLAFDQILQNAGLSEQGYVTERRRSAIRAQLTSIMDNSAPVSQTMLAAWNQYWNATRDASYFVINEKSIDPLEAPDETKLKAYFEDNKFAFTAPEYRDLSVLLVDPELLKKTIKISNADVKAHYDANIGAYNVPEKRTIEQIPFPDAASAKDAEKKIKAGTKFEDIAKELGLSDADRSLGSVTKGELLDPKIAEATFALKKGAVSAPVSGKISTVILRVTDIVPGLTRSFEEMKDKILSDLQKEQAANKILDLYDIIEDARAGGATLKEIAAKNELQYFIVTTDKNGRGTDGQDVKDLTAHRSILSPAFQSDVGIENDAVELFQGAYAWFEVIKVTPSRDRTFAEARSEIEKNWRADQLRKKLKAKADELVEQGNQGKSLADLAKSVKAKVEKPVNFRRSANLKNFPRTATRLAFTMEKGKFGAAIQEAGPGRVIFTLTKINPPDALTDGGETKFEERISGGLVDDLLAQYLTGLQNDMGLSINQQVVNRLTGAGQSEN